MKNYAYYIPGYTGFCPDLKDHFGQTYGSATRQILKEKPYLKERLAPVFYRERKWGKNAKKFGHQKQRHRDGSDCGCHKEEYEDKMRCGRGMADHHSHDGRCEDQVKRKERVCPTETKYKTRMVHERCLPDYVVLKSKKPKVRFEAGVRKKSMDGDGDKPRVPDHLCYCPSYVYIETIAECHPMKWDPQEGSDVYHAHYPAASNRAKWSGHGHAGDCETTNGHCHNGVKRVPRIKPHREGGVIPKYTGHIPGMIFSFGEAYGPASYRLLRRHHDNMKYLDPK